ncbi:MAG: hypothetical protein ACKO3K_06630 [Cuspidothrix sp.]
MTTAIARINYRIPHPENPENPDSDNVPQRSLELTTEYLILKILKSWKS